MMKQLSALALALLTLSACGGKANDKPAASENVPAAESSEAVAKLPETHDLKIFNWSDYIDPDTIKAFEKKNNVKVQYDTYDSDETLESKMLTGKSGYDLAGPSNTFVGRQINAGAYQKIDKNLIPNYKNINPKLLALMENVDPGNQYAVPFFWGTNTFAINVDRVKAALGTDKLPDNQWDLVFNPEYTNKLKSCGISYLDSAAEIYPMVLHYLGKDPESKNIDDLKAATEVLKANRPNIMRFTSSGFIDDLANGNTCATIGYGGDLNIAKRRAEEAGGHEKIRVMMPKEGVGIWVDSYVIPKDAKNVLNAHKYINDTLDPEVAAKNGNYVTYAPASVPAQKLMDAKYRNEDTIFPTDEQLDEGFIMKPIPPESLKFMVRQWQGLKAGK